MKFLFALIVCLYSLSVVVAARQRNMSHAKSKHMYKKTYTNSTAAKHGKFIPSLPDMEQIMARSTVRSTNEFMVKGLPKARLQWQENYGYCGETSFITAGMTKAGFWMSQFDLRDIATGPTDQSKSSAQLLIGVNDEDTADTCLFNEESWDEDTINAKSFITFLKKNILANEVIVIGIFMNGYVFGSEEDEDYDHIVTVVGWGSEHPLTDLGYYADDVIMIQDNGIFDDDTGIPLYNFGFKISEFLQTRSNANKKTAPVYSLNGSPSEDHPNYGIVLKSQVDDDGDCMPLYIDTDRNDESPGIGEGKKVRPKVMKINLLVRVESLTAGKTYNLYQYASFEDTPTSEFNKHAKDASDVTTFTATATTYSSTVAWTNDKIAIFRCVPTTAD